MNVGAPIGPRPPPRGVVDEHGVCAPVKSSEAQAPAPRRKESADAHAESETDRAADHKAGPRSKEHDCRIVVWHDNESRVDGHDRDVGPPADDNLAAAAQVSEIPSLAAVGSPGTELEFAL